MEAVTLAADRLHAFVDATVAITAELSLAALLQQLVEAAAALTGARYAALGVIDRSGSELERFLTTGMDADTHVAIGELPRGRGILGVLISDAKPLRLHDLGKHERSVGFPENHPLMRTFLGVPIHLRGVAYGNLYLTEKAGGDDFSEEDEEIVLLLAGQAAVDRKRPALLGRHGVVEPARIAQRGGERARIRNRARALARSDRAPPTRVAERELRRGAPARGQRRVAFRSRCRRRQPRAGWKDRGAVGIEERARHGTGP